MDERTIARFESKVDKSAGADACWPWKTTRDRKNYGVAYFQRKTHRAHRVAFLIANGHWPEPCCLHSCDNPPCCNPAHLSAGTRADNAADMRSKGRQALGDLNGARTCPDRVARGERHGTKTRPDRVARGDRHRSKTHPESVKRGEENAAAKFTEDDVLGVLAMRGTGSLREISIRSGMSTTNVRNILKGNTWKHLSR